MSTIPKHEKIKTWLKEYLKEFGEYSGTVEELAQLTNTSAYLVRKAISELEEEGLLKAESKRGKGLHITMAKEETAKEIKDSEETSISTQEEQKEAPQEEAKIEKKKRKTSLQDEVLSSLLGKEITVFLISGTRLEGKLLDFDNFTLSMTAPKGKSLVYKHAIATIIYE
ncbi:RNA chaperone Hfq [Desulfurobacterium atlanticum]|uniref:RNA chaperone Hfq n=1 Tax=Desulfurobacterium atlanticum TaxID=240169 RepID=A0A238XLV8_9BACT|nr:RNA chaperone Hfq [Desulfurobacterium atlanticum]SNR60006.1 RNA chaperone Hfq [Desulfurobacterium atlanticum]